MYIGKAAKQSGTTPTAIRLYEQLGLLPDLERKGKYRVFSVKEIEIIKMIKIFQSVGYSLSEIKEMLSPEVIEDIFPLDEIILILEKKINVYKNEIEMLEQKKKELNVLCELFKKYKEKKSPL